MKDVERIRTGVTAGASSSTYPAGHKGYGPVMPGTMVLPAPNCYRCPIRHCRDRCDMTRLEVGVGLADSQAEESQTDHRGAGERSYASSCIPTSENTPSTHFDA